MTTYAFTVLAIAELVFDKLPNASSRKSPPGFIARIASGALCGSAVGLGGGGAVVFGLIAGAVGAAVGYARRL